MVKRIIIWVLVIAFAYFFFSTIAKSCKNNTSDAIDATTTTVEDGIDASSEKLEDIASFEEDDEDDSYTIDDEDDRSDRDNEEDEDDFADEEDEFGDEDDLEAEDDLADEKDSDVTDAAKSKITSTTTNNKSTSSNQDIASYSQRRYLVVTGSFKEEINANNMVEQLQEMGYNDAEVFTFDFAEYYSVTAGRYHSSSEANKVASTLKAKGIDCYAHKMRSKYFD